MLCILLFENVLNLKFRDDIVDLFDHYIKQYKIPVTRLTGSVEQRVNKIMETIK